MLLLKKDQVTNWLNNLMQTYQVFAPEKDGKSVNFKQISSSDQVVLDYYNSRIPPKEVLFPRSEKLFCYSSENGGVELTEQIEQGKKVVFGIRPCDANSFGLLDKVFDGDQYEDPYYLTRRKDTALVGIGCNHPCSTCFCTAFGGNGPFSTEGLDILLTDTGDQYLVEAVTEKGKELLSGMELPDAGQDVKDAALAVKESATCSSQVNLGGLKYQLDINFEEPIWKFISEKCLGCGACTYSCPTCHCFDIVDEVSGKQGCRVRNWDACMYPLFTLHGSGHNPRPSGKERFRQRVMHKFKYFIDNYGATACVGCGRCIVNCPVNIDIRQVIEQIRQAGGDQ